MVPCEPNTGYRVGPVIKLRRNSEKVPARSMKAPPLSEAACFQNLNTCPQSKSPNLCYHLLRNTRVCQESNFFPSLLTYLMGPAKIVPTQWLNAENILETVWDARVPSPLSHAVKWAFLIFSLHIAFVLYLQLFQKWALKYTGNKYVHIYVCGEKERERNFQPTVIHSFYLEILLSPDSVVHFTGGSESRDLSSSHSPNH